MTNSWFVNGPVCVLSGTVLHGRSKEHALARLRAIEKEEQMPNRIAIAVEKKEGMGSRLSRRFGFARNYVIVDSETGHIVSEMDNEPTHFSSQIGTREALHLKNNQVQKVISKEYGSTAYSMLDDLNIETWIMEEDETATEAVRKLLSGELVANRKIVV
jgi:predicted Fe-Mo cluster-binding NifX family protein